MSRATEAKREARIFERCERLAKEISAELLTSRGEHWEDLEALEELMEVWEVLRLSAEEEALNEARERRVS